MVLNTRNKLAKTPTYELILQQLETHYYRLPNPWYGSFFPEPHIWGKIKWVAGGATGMTFKDWFDILLHGVPFVLLIRIVSIKILSFIK